MLLSLQPVPSWSSGCTPGSMTGQLLENFWFQQIRGPSPRLHPDDWSTLHHIWKHQGMLNHAVRWGRVVADECRWGRSRRTQGRQRKQWIGEINQSSPATTSPPLREEEAACWWLYDGWLIQDSSDLWWWIAVWRNRTLAELKTAGSEVFRGNILMQIETCWCGLM